MDGWTLLHQADGMDGNGCTDLHFHPFHPFEKVRGVDRHTEFKGGGAINFVLLDVPNQYETNRI
jgi:hypothetical protein